MIISKISMEIKGSEKMPNSMVVPKQSSHKHKSRGGCMDENIKPAKVIKSGNTTIEIYAPPPMSEEEKERRIEEFHHAAWAIWNSLTIEEKLKINAEYGCQ